MHLNALDHLSHSTCFLDWFDFYFVLLSDPKDCSLGLVCVDSRGKRPERALGLGLVFVLSSLVIDVKVPALLGTVLWLG